MRWTPWTAMEKFKSHFRQERRVDVLVTVSDTGPGIPKAKRKQIFEPGYTTKPRGWGLGLSLCKRIIEEYHGGRISVGGSEVLGSEFLIQV